MLCAKCFLSHKKVWSKTIFSPKEFVGSKKMLTQNSFGPKSFLNQNIFCSKKILGSENFGSKQIWVEKIWVKKIAPLFWIQKILDQNSRAKNFRSKKCRSTNSRPPKYYLVKIGSVTSKIFLKWTNVTRTNVAWTNVTVTVGICLRWSHEPTFKIWSKFG